MKDSLSLSTLKNVIQGARALFTMTGDKTTIRRKKNDSWR
jgi:hypothetical protein